MAGLGSTAPSDRQEPPPYPVSLEQFALRGFERGLAGIHHAAGRFQGAGAHAETELLNHDGVSGGRQRHAVHPVHRLQHQPFQRVPSGGMAHPVVTHAQEPEVRARLGGHAVPYQFVFVRHQYPVNSM